MTSCESKATAAQSPAKVMLRLKLAIASTPALRCAGLDGKTETRERYICRRGKRQRTRRPRPDTYDLPAFLERCN